MPRNLSEEVLNLIRTNRPDQGPISLAHLSRQLGVSNQLMSSCAAEMVGRGLAEPQMMMMRGVSTLRGLMPQALPLSPAAG
jgi:Mn-dependent DtxR family transcriptional regulator